MSFSVELSSCVTCRWSMSRTLDCLVFDLSPPHCHNWSCDGLVWKCPMPEPGFSWLGCMLGAARSVWSPTLCVQVHSATPRDCWYTTCDVLVVCWVWDVSWWILFPGHSAQAVPWVWVVLLSSVVGAATPKIRSSFIYHELCPSHS